MSDQALEVRRLVHGQDLTGKDGPMTKAGTRLAKLYHYRTSSDHSLQSAAEDVLATVFDGRVVVDAVASKQPRTLLKRLKELGLRNGARSGRIVSGLLPIGALREAASLQNLNFMRPAVRASSAGDVTTQGDVAMHADDARSEDNVQGTGMKVGVISDTYNQKFDPGVPDAGDDIDTGDLPPQSKIQILEDPSLNNPKDEGRAMMQIIRDVAPNTRQSFHGGFLGRANMIEAIRDLAAANSDVIVDDLIYFAQPFFQDGRIAQVADSVAIEGVPYFSAAGNAAQKSYSSIFQEVVVGENNRVFHNFNSGEATDIYQTVQVPVGETVQLSVQWSDPYLSAGGPGAESDVDVYVVNDTLGIEQSSIGANIGDDPTEVFQFTNDGSIDADEDGNPDTVFSLAFELFQGEAPEQIKYVHFDQASGPTDALTMLEYDTQSPTSFGHPNAGNVAGVAAASYQDTPAFGASPPEVRPFSSEGGVPIYYNKDGEQLPEPEVRSKPDFVAPDDADNTFFGSDSDGDGFPNFSGTSAAAPHAAAVAALMLDKNPSLSPQQIYTKLENSAIDMDDPATPGFDQGFDFRTGQGLIQADVALNSIEAQTKLFVDQDATGANTGASWTDAYRYLQDAFDEVNRHPSLNYEIWISEGTYHPDFDAIGHFGSPPYDHALGDRTESFTVIRDSVEVYGGFSGGETAREERNPETNEVLLSGDIGAESDTSDNSYHVVYLDGRNAAPITPGTVLDGLTITQGNAGGSFPNEIGGGLFCEGGGAGNGCSPTLAGITFSENYAKFGGALFINGSGIEATSSFSGSSLRQSISRSPGISHPAASDSRTGSVGDNVGHMASSKDAGAPSPSSLSALSISSSSFTANVADVSGGAIYNWGQAGLSNPIITGTDFFGNQALFGGAIYNDGEAGTANPTFFASKFQDNAAEQSGGVIYSNAREDGSSSPVFLRVRAISNEADYGGAFYFNGTGGTSQPILSSSVFSGNVADTSGGVAYNRGVNGVVSPSIVGVTAAGNEAQFGGAIFNDGRNSGTASPTLENSILWANAAPTGPQMSNLNSGATPEVTYSIIEGGRDGISESGGSSTTYDESTNIESSPQFAAGAGPDNTWGTDDDDVRLQGPGSGGGPSPGIDAGNNAALDLDGDGSIDISGDVEGKDRRKEVDDVPNSGSGSAPLADMGAHESAGAPLPIELAHFNAQLSEGAVVVTWKTVSETRNAAFQIQRKTSDEGENWITIGRRKGAGNSTEPQTYQFEDSNLSFAADRFTYRLKQVDISGSATYSKTVTVRPGISKVRLLETFPNPAQGQTTVRYTLPNKLDVSIRLYDVIGREVRTFVTRTQEGRHETVFDVSGLPSGTYFLKLTAGHTTRTQKLMIMQ